MLCTCYWQTLGALCQRMNCPVVRVRQRPQEQRRPSSAAAAVPLLGTTRQAPTRINRCQHRPPSLHRDRPRSQANRPAPLRRRLRRPRIRQHLRRPRHRYLEASLSKEAPPPSATPPRVALTWWWVAAIFFLLLQPRPNPRSSERLFLFLESFVWRCL